MGVQCKGGIMEGMASACSYQQSIEELKRALFCTTLELESTQIAAEEEKRRNDEYVKHLLELLEVAFQERDEANDHLQMLLNSIAQSNSTEVPLALPNLLPETTPIMAAKGNSSITESESLSETCNRRSYVSSSPVDSFLDAVTSPELSNINMADSSNIAASIQPVIQDYKASSYNGISFEMSHIDPASAIIDRLVMKKPLPEKGKLLQAVMEAGPLLQTLLVAGPLPQWRNPPPLRSSQVPPVTIKGCDSAAVFQKTALSSTCPVQSSTATSPYDQTSVGASRVCSTPMLNFSRTFSSCLKRPVLSYGIGDGIVNNQKFQC